MKHAMPCMLALSCIAAATPARAAYPDRPIRLIAGFPAGGNADVIARVVAQKMSENIGRQVVVDNRGGAGGIIGTELAAHAVPDGYTIVLIALSHAVNAVIQKKLPFDPVKDFTPISLVSSVPNVLVVHNSVPVNSVPELINLAKAKPGGLNYVSSTGTSLHVAGELFKTMAGVNITRVTYKSGGSAQTDLEAGRVQMSFSAMITAMAMLKGGRVKALAITSAKRSPILPDVPAVAEFVPGYEVTGWQGVMGPAKLPASIVQKLSEELKKAAFAPDVEKRLQAAGAEPAWNSPPEFTKFITNEITKMSRILSKTDMMNEN